MRPSFPHSRLCAALAIAVLGWSGNAGFAQSRTSAGNPLDQLPKIQAPGANVTVETSTGVPPSDQSARIVTPVSFKVEGVRSIPFAPVQALFTPFAGHAVKVEDLTAAAKQVTAMYQASGFALSFCFVPEQDLSSGVVRVVAVEGYVRDVHIEGDAGGSEAAIRRVTDSITEDKPLRSATFTRMVALLTRLPGISIDATVPAPTTTDGASDLILKVKRRPLVVATGLDTYRPGERVLASATANGLTPLGDQLTVSTLLSHGTDDERYQSVSETVPVASSGLLLRMDAYHFSSNTQLTLAPGVDGNDHQSDSRLSISASTPLILQSDHQLILNGSFDAAHNIDHYDGSAAAFLADQQEQLRIVHVGLAATGTLARQQLAASADVFRGISGLGASVSNPMIDGDFTRLVLAMSDRLSWTDSVASNFGIRGQFSRDRLPSSEQIGFGGQQFGLAYPVSDEVGDRGWGVSLDLGKTFAVGLPYLAAVEPYVALDSARAYNNLLTLVPGRMASFAIGTRLADGHHYNIDLAIARPIGALPIDVNRRALRFNLNFSYRSE